MKQGAAMASRELGRSMLQVGGMPVARAAVPISNHDQDDDRDDGDADGMEGFQDNGCKRDPPFRVPNAGRWSCSPSSSGTTCYALCDPGFYGALTTTCLGKDEGYTAVSGSCTLCPTGGDKAALLAAKPFLVGTDTREPLSTWTTDTEPCPPPGQLITWTGILCNMTTGRVLGIQWIPSPRRGVFPLNGTLSDVLACLDQLQVLSISAPDDRTRPDDRRVGGSLPAAYGSLTRLQRLSLHGHTLTGPLPITYGNLQQVEIMTLSSNLLTGPLPWVYGNMAALKTLQLDGNKLSGPLPYSWAGLKALRRLELTRNQLNGTLPKSFARLPSLDSLLLGGNKLTGRLPKSWRKLATLASLILGDNQLSGPLPSAWSIWAKMTFLNLDSNQLTGTLPKSWGSWSQLGGLYVSRNQFTGTLPASWGNMTSLDSLFINGNMLRGSLPSTWANQPMGAANVSYNPGLEGCFPSQGWLFAAYPYGSVSGTNLTFAVCAP